MPVSAPFVEAEQDRPVGIEDLPKVIMSRKACRLTEQRLYQWKLPATSPTPMIVHVRLIGPLRGRIRFQYIGDFGFERFWRTEMARSLKRCLGCHCVAQNCPSFSLNSVRVTGRTGRF